MNYKIIIQAHFPYPGEPDADVIGVKENIAAVLEHIGVSVDYINVKEVEE